MPWISCGQFRCRIFLVLIGSIAAISLTKAPMLPKSPLDSGRISAVALPSAAATETDGASSLFFAAYFGIEEPLQTVFARGDDLDPTDGDGSTPLMYAAKQGHRRIVEQLIDHGANRHCLNRHGESCMHFAVASGNPSVVRLLIESGASPLGRNQYGWSPIMRAILLERSSDWRQFGEIQKLLLPHSRAMDVSDAAERLKAFDLASSGNVDALRRMFLTSKYCHAPDIRDYDGRTPLMFAAISGRLGVVDFLVESGADINLRDHDGQTVLHIVAERGGNLNTIHELLAMGADPKIADDANRLPEAVASHFQRDAVARMLARGRQTKPMSNRRFNLY